MDKQPIDTWAGGMVYGKNDRAFDWARTQIGQAFVLCFGIKHFD